MPLDKIAHVLAGAVIALALGYFAPVWVAFALACAVGLGKEWYDDLHPETNTASWQDFAATVMGGFAGAGFVLVVQLAKGML